MNKRNVNVREKTVKNENKPIKNTSFRKLLFKAIIINVYDKCSRTKWLIISREQTRYIKCLSSWAEKIVYGRKAF